jgi:hypothetical protein
LNERSHTRGSQRSRHDGADRSDQHSFELAAVRCEDLTPLVYRRLFSRTSGSRSDVPKPSQRTRQGFDAGADHRFASDRTGHFRMIQCEVQSHDAYGTPAKLFGNFFGVIADTVREILGADWSPQIEQAWRKLLTEIEGVITQSDVLSEPRTLPSS